jgi:hypothetical protein
LYSFAARKLLKDYTFTKKEKHGLMESAVDYRSEERGRNAMYAGL